MLPAGAAGSVAGTDRGRTGAVPALIRADDVAGASRPYGAPRRSALSGAQLRSEDAIPEWRADAVAALVVLEVMAHVQLAQALTEGRLRPVMVHVVVQHVVEQI